jgi:hypothetical protein
MITLEKMIPFLLDGSAYCKPRSIAHQFLRGFKFSTLFSYNAATKKFMTFWKDSHQNNFCLPASAEEICEFCFWASRNKETQTAQEVTAKTVEKYLYGIQVWHKYHSKQYLKEAKKRVHIILRAAAKVKAQMPAPSNTTNICNLTQRKNYCLG